MSFSSSFAPVPTTTATTTGTLFSFELKVKRAIELLSSIIYSRTTATPILLLLVDKQISSFPVCSSSETAWKQSVLAVLKVLCPKATSETPSDWAISIRDELIEIQKENGVNLKVAFQILESRLDKLLQILGGSNSTTSSENEQPHCPLQHMLYHHKRLRPVEGISTALLVDRKITKKVKLYKKRLREFTQEDDDTNAL